tara:strand:+ start:3346 stop:4314 length:969 start_codon:yes stop_codon:yes gene_type:complete
LNKLKQEKTKKFPIIQILSIGEALVEFMASKIDQRLDQPGEFLGPFASGAPAIFIGQAAKLGVSAKLIACLGKDSFGQLIETQLKKYGADITGLIFLEGYTTGCAFVSYDNKGDRQFIFHMKDAACGQLNTKIVSQENWSDYMHLHLMGSTLINSGIIELSIKACKLIKKHGGTISLDPNIRPELVDDEQIFGLKEILKKCDYFMPSESEITSLSQSNQTDQAIKEYLDLGIKEVVIKLGKKGAAAHTKRQTYEQPGFLVNEVDPTGAGDVFGGAYLSARLQGEGIERSLKEACACGAQAVTLQGPMEGLFDRTQLDHFLSN